MIAFIIDVYGFDPMAAAADTMPKARYLTWRRAQEAGYYSVTFGAIRSKRAPDLDAWAARQNEPLLVSLSHARAQAR